MTNLATIGEKAGLESRPKADVDTWAPAIGGMLGTNFDQLAAMK